MTTAELIAHLREIDPSGEEEVRIYIHRRYGGWDRPLDEVRKFYPAGAVMLTDERDEDI